MVVPAGLYALSEELRVFADVTITGAGPTSTIVSQGGGDRVIEVMYDPDPVDLTVDGLTLTGEHARDGNAGDDRSWPTSSPGQPGTDAFADGGQSGDDGGAILNDHTGTLVVLNARITGNSAGNGGHGGSAKGGDGRPPAPGWHRSPSRRR